MLFCPNCANGLQVTANGIGQQQFSCRTCPYVHRIEQQYGIERTAESMGRKKKQVDDILGADGAWDNVDSTEAPCPKCEHTRAYFMQIQIRSADEPMSTFFKCVKCAFQWREG